MRPYGKVIIKPLLTEKNAILKETLNKVAFEVAPDANKIEVKKAVEEGAWGISSGLEYTPGSFATTEEIIEVASVLKGTNYPYVTHMRSEGDRLIEAVEEAIQISKGAGIPLHISHLKVEGKRNWHKADLLFETKETKDEFLSLYKQDMVKIKKVQADIPLKYRQMTLDIIDFPESKSTRDKVGHYMNKLDERKKNGKGLFLWSEINGTAKTSLACIILIEALKKGYSGCFTNLGECVDLFASGWYDTAAKEQFERQVLETDFLIIDDVGGFENKSGNSKGMMETTFTRLLKSRCNYLLPTIMTSNLKPEELDNAYGARIYNATSEHLEIIKCEGVNYVQNIMPVLRKKG